jgi:hypothetical protein
MKPIVQNSPYVRGFLTKEDIELIEKDNQIYENWERRIMNGERVGNLINPPPVPNPIVKARIEKRLAEKHALEQQGFDTPKPPIRRAVNSDRFNKRGGKTAQP